MLLATAALAVPATAQATLTIGSNLGRAPEGIMSSFGCSPPCTLSQDTLSADRQAPGGLVSPVNGTITRWRIGAAGASSPTSLRVIRPLGGGLFTGAATSATVTPALNTTSAFTTQLPIKVGDSIGINCCQPFAEYFLLSGGTMREWQPVLADGGPGRASAGPGDPHELVLNADIEPTTGFAINLVKAGKGGKLTVVATYPNPGTLTGGDARDKRVATAAGGKKQQLFLTSTSRKVQVPGQTISILMKPTKLARALLARKGTLKAKAQVVFTPTGGSASTQIVKAKLKR